MFNVKLGMNGDRMGKMVEKFEPMLTRLTVGLYVPRPIMIFAGYCFVLFLLDVKRFLLYHF